MIWADFSDFVSHSRQHFEEGLIRAGYEEIDGGWRGRVEHSLGRTEVIVSLPHRFPFVPPQATPADIADVPWSWHRERNGALCLVADDDHDDLWWREAPAFLEHVAAWFESCHDDWKDDRPDLDLDRYFRTANDDRLYVYGDLDAYRGQFVRFGTAPNNTMAMKGRGTRPAKVSKHLRDQFGYVADLGTVDVPPRNWEDLLARIDAPGNIERKIRDRLVGLLVLTYQRGDHEGTTFLKVTPTSSGGIDVRRLRSGADTPLARSVRSGRHSVELGTRGVAVIGVGAIGSFVADMLIRAGVGRLTLVDDDVVMPGNLIRHLAGPEAVGLPKAEAVKDQLLRKYRLRDDQVEAACHNVLTSDVVFQAIQNHDLVINATADFAVTAFLHAAAYAAGTHVLSAALQNDGDTIRIDVLPPVAGARPLPSSASPGSHKEPTYYEAGCGSPISPTPPHIAIETAAVTVRHAIGLLLDEPVHPSGEIRHLKHTRNQ